METTYCENCGLLHDPDDGKCLGCEMSKEIKELKEILLEVGATTHTSKKLYDWYIANGCK